MAEQFGTILASLLSTDNNIRTQAEEAYNAVPLESRVVFLLNVVQNHGTPEEERQMAAVLLRRLFTSDFSEFFSKLNVEGQTQLKAQLLVAVQSEQTDSIRRKTCDVVAEVARNLLDDDGNNLWPEFLQFLFQCANSPTPQLKEAALRMFTSVPGVFGIHQSEYLNLIKQMLQQSLLDTSSYHVRFQAVRAVSAFILLHDKEFDIQKHFVDLLPLIIQVIAESVQQQDDDALLKCLIDLGESTPKFLRSQVESIVTMCIKVFENTDIGDSWRHLALEVIVTLTETAPPMMRKEAPKYLPTLVPLILRMMTDLEDDDDWSVMDEISEDDSDSNNVVAESALDRLACSLGGKTVFPMIVANIPEMMKHPDWKYRHASLMAISAVGEGCQKHMEEMLPFIVDAVLHFIHDPHPRVRYAACNAIGQMSSDFAPNFQKKFHDRVVPGLLSFLEDNENPRVQAHAGAALVNFSEDCPKTILTQYLNSIMSKLNDILGSKFVELVQKGTKLVLEQVVTTIASVADSCEEQFMAYYDTLVPRLKYIIKESTQPELKLLRGKTIECISLIGLAVGPEKFMSDAVEVMDMLLKSHSDLPDDDPQTSYLISAWARICKIMGKQFEQYLPLVIGPVMRTASLKPEVALLDNDDMEDVSQDVDWQFVSLGEQQNFGIKTAGLEDKASACEMLVCYARELKEGFANYAEDVAKMMVPMLKFYFHDGVRSAAAQSMPCLLECAQIKGPNFLREMWNFMCTDLLKAIESEPENEVLTELMYSMAKCIEILGNGCLSEVQMTELLAIIDKQLKEHFEREVERLEKRKDEDYDEVVEEQLANDTSEDIYTLSKVADIIHALFVTYKTDFFPYLDQIIGHFVKMLEPSRLWSDHQWGLCIFDDVIEFGGPACVKYQSVFLGPMMTHVTDRTPEVRQAAVYGCGVLGMHGGDAFSASCAEVLPRLIEIIRAPDSRSVENINATENAISAVTKILHHNNKSFNVDEILPHWLSWLPVWEDTDEAPHVYGYLCHLIQSGHPAIIGANNVNVPKLICIMTEAFHRGAIAYDHPVAVNMITIIRQIQASGELFHLCVNQLSPDQQQALNEALSSK